MAEATRILRPAPGRTAAELPPRGAAPAVDTGK
jgi:hypothetical protein